MLAIDQVLISDEVIEEKFVCDLSGCHGGCCVDGDTGAPLDKEETALLDDIYEEVKPYLSVESIREIERQGKYVYDDETGFVTPTIGGKMCVYGVLEHGVVKCGIEKACNDHRISFKKPISCHLYPIRVQSYDGYEAMNYEPRDKLCHPAWVLGEKLQVPVYRFLKEAIIRKYDEFFYEAMEEFARFGREKDAGK
jgi:hypothetical protein